MCIRDRRVVRVAEIKLHDDRVRTVLRRDRDGLLHDLRAPSATDRELVGTRGRAQLLPVRSRHPAGREPAKDRTAGDRSLISIFSSKIANFFSRLNN